MRVLLAPDSFKGTLSAAEVAAHLAAGLAERGVETRSLPLADGGEGSVQAAVHAGFEPVAVHVTGPTGLPRTALIAVDGRTAVVEVADTCGLPALPGGVLAPLTSSSRGVGDGIRAALKLGARRVVLALGGSASTDGGAGMLAALGVRFWAADGRPVDVCGATLQEIRMADAGALLDLRGIDLILASDVDNPLTGPTGAAAIYGPQKGASGADVRTLDAGLRNLVAHLARAFTEADAEALSRTPGAGSAGGIGFAALLLGGTLVSGADFFLDLLDFDSAISGCDLVVTGEGRIDAQTARGKLPATVAKRAGGIPVIAVVGRRDIDDDALAAMGIADVIALSDRSEVNTAGDPVLSAQLLTEIGRTLPLHRHIGGHP